MFEFSYFPFNFVEQVLRFFEIIIGANGFYIFPDCGKKFLAVFFAQNNR